MNATELTQKIRDCIHDEVRPYIELDGGRIEFVRLDGDVVFVRLFGACVTCPSSLVTLKGGVERTVKERFAQITSVELEGLGTDTGQGFVREVSIDL